MSAAFDVSPQLSTASRRRMPFARAATIALIGLSLAAPTAGAQDTTSAAADRWLTTFSVGVPGVRGEPVPELFTLGAQWTQLRPGRLGADVALGVMPRAIQAAVLAGGMRLGVALPIALSPGVLLLPSTGVSVIGAVGQGGGGGDAGLNAGFSTIFLTSSGMGLRTGVTWHRFAGARAAMWLLEFGIGRGR